jgi:hypothetical protein
VRRGRGGGAARLLTNHRRPVERVVAGGAARIACGARRCDEQASACPPTPGWIARVWRYWTFAVVCAVRIYWLTCPRTAHHLETIWHQAIDPEACVGHGRVSSTQPRLELRRTDRGCAPWRYCRDRLRGPLRPIAGCAPRRGGAALIGGSRGRDEDGGDSSRSGDYTVHVFLLLVAWWMAWWMAWCR